MPTLSEIESEERLPAVVADERGLIVRVNGAFTEAFGWTAQEAVGKPLTLIIPPALRDAHHLGFSRFLTTGAPTLLDRPLRLKAMTKAGKVLDAEHFIVAERGEGGWRFAATLRPLQA